MAKITCPLRKDTWIKHSKVFIVSVDEPAMQYSILDTEECGVYDLLF
jgi:hypothetical protein